MFKKTLAILFVAVLQITTVSFVEAYPQWNDWIHMSYFSQKGWSGILGCQDDDTDCQNSLSRKGHTLGKYGCSVASMAMVYRSYGFGSIPDDNHHSTYIGRALNPASLNNYLSKPVGYGPGGNTLGYDYKYDMDWWKTTGNLYYRDVLAYFSQNSNTLVSYSPYYYVVPNYDCSPFVILDKATYPFFSGTQRAAECFMINWDHPDTPWLSGLSAMVLLDQGSDPKNPSLVRIFRADGTLVSGFAPYDATHTYGVMVSSGDIDGDGVNEIITGLGPGPQSDPLVKLYKTDGTVTGSFMAYPSGTGYGVRAIAGKTGR